MRARPLAGVLLGVGLISAPFAFGRRPTFVWNASASLPIGFYRITRGFPQLRDTVLVRLAPSFVVLAARRGYLPISAYLLKPVAAVSGDLVCRLGARIYVRGRLASLRHRDGRGRPMPTWHGCRRLRTGELFLVAENSDSFDSRYFGPVLHRAAAGRAVRIWFFDTRS
jgi:conjugative transfer signal peptidase TraF